MSRVPSVEAARTRVRPTPASPQALDQRVAFVVPVRLGVRPRRLPLPSRARRAEVSRYAARRSLRSPAACPSPEASSGNTPTLMANYRPRSARRCNQTAESRGPPEPRALPGRRNRREPQPRRDASGACNVQPVPRRAVFSGGVRVRAASMPGHSADGKWKIYNPPRHTHPGSRRAAPIGKMCKTGRSERKPRRKP